MSEDEIQKIIEKEEHLKKYCGEDEVILSPDMLKLLESRIDATYEVEMKSGFPSLDKEIHSFIGGELVVLSGPTKGGKTLVGQTFTRNFEQQGKGCLWFTYEVPAYQFLKQFGDRLPLFVMPKQLKQNSFSWILDRVHEAKLKYSISAVFIDNTHNVLNLTASNLSQVMGEFLKASKQMAIKYNVVVFLLHHMKQVKLLEGEEFGSHLLRDSSLVAQTADTVMFVWRDKDIILNRNKSYLKITENRRYGVMNYTITMSKIGNFLEECEFHHGI